MFLILNSSDEVLYVSKIKPTVKSKEVKTIHPRYGFPLVIADLNKNNCSVIETAETLPNDFVGMKYKYTDGTFSKNKAYVEPEEDKKPEVIKESDLKNHEVKRLDFKL